MPDNRQNHTLHIYRPMCLSKIIYGSSETVTLPRLCFLFCTFRSNIYWSIFLHTFGIRLFSIYGLDSMIDNKNSQSQILPGTGGYKIPCHILYSYDKRRCVFDLALIQFFLYSKQAVCLGDGMLLSNTNAAPFQEKLLRIFYKILTTCNYYNRFITMNQYYFKIACERVHNAWAQPDLFIDG